jgi:PAS domain S-box-containing protein
MQERRKTRRQLVDELAVLRQRVAELEGAEAERKQAEAAEEHNLLHTLIDNLPDYIYVKDAEGRFVIANMAVVRQMGLTTLDELVGKTDFDFFPHELAERYYAEEQVIIQSGHALYDYEGPTVDAGEERWVSTTKVPLRDAQGEVMGFVGLGRDITERKRAEAALRESEARYRALIESQTDLISRYRPDTTLTFVNDAYCQFYGKTREELIGHSYLFMITPEFRELVRKETENMVRDPRPVGGEYLNYRQDGMECWIHWGVRGIVDENGRVVELQAVGHDITDRKRAEAQLDRNLRETRVRFEISQALAGAETEDEVLNVLIQHACLYLQAHVAILTFDRTGSELAVILRRQDTFESGLIVTIPTGTRLPASSFTLLNLYRSDQPFVSNDFLADERVDPVTRELYRPGGVASYASFPLTAGNEWMGYIMAFAKPAGYFDEEKQHLYQTNARRTGRGGAARRSLASGGP